MKVWDIVIYFNYNLNSCWHVLKIFSLYNLLLWLFKYVMIVCYTNVVDIANGKTPQWIIDVLVFFIVLF